MPKSLFHKMTKFKSVCQIPISNFSKLLILFWLLVSVTSCKAQTSSPDLKIVVGADQTESYLPVLKNKNVAIVANPTSCIGSVHLVDTLKSLGVSISCVFAPEHGFRGKAEAGELIGNDIDKATGVKIVSLYGTHKKPTKEDLLKVDIIIFDIQDVGVRFYTYISTLQYVMEACAENNLELIILDRPNPHGYYIDGPVLDTAYKSFVGMQAIPIVHGLTMGEYAQMLNGEKWLENKVKCNLKIIKIKNWDHTKKYELPIPPSPNLPNQIAVNLYPSLCFFEGTIVSVGRGTDKPFQIFGYPNMPEGNYFFTPKSIVGKAKNPPYENTKCQGFDLTDFGILYADQGRQRYLNWVIQSYQFSNDRGNWFNSFFDKLAGNSILKKQIIEGVEESQIRNSWGPDLLTYRMMRKKYLLYKDFK